MSGVTCEVKGSSSARDPRALRVTLAAQMPTHSYTIKDIERVLRLSRSTIRGLIESGFVTPARGPRQQYRFSFQDLIVLRAARALIEADSSIQGSLEAQKEVSRLLEREGRASVHWSIIVGVGGADVVGTLGVARVASLVQLEGVQRGA